MVRLPPGTDLLAGIEGLAREEGLETATFQCLGAVRNAKLAFYNQEAKQYEEFSVDQPMEIILCHGNVSLKEGQPFVHAHAALSDAQGKTVSGHVLPGTEIFVCEVTLQEWRGAPLVRKRDGETGLWMWPVEPR